MSIDFVVKCATHELSDLHNYAINFLFNKYCTVKTKKLITFND